MKTLLFALLATTCFAADDGFKPLISGQPTSELIDHHADKRTLEGLLAI